ncbi:MAG: tRNA pseudouridine(38-40) synthase TruA [Erysipelotrichia bacterium]|nr:tRNA pseudouridine(38-40) synthase TruA [Erysipelotrichia bacterium]
MRYKCVVSYDGNRFAGWQKQADDLTIQETIEKAISRIVNHEVVIVASGRTDAKVHALGQVFHFETDKEISNFQKAINSQLPDDVYIRSVEEVTEDFHSRFDAKYKRYNYLINNGEYNPCMANYSCYIKEKLDIDLMKRASEVFIGTLDFTSFNATKLCENENQIRTIYKIEITKKDDLITISYYGNGFLRYMVRMITQTLIEAGLGSVSISEIQKMLDKKDKTACSYNASANGLYLVEVGYKEYQKNME